MSDADEFFSGGNKSLSFKQLGQGTWVTGRIIGIGQPRQATDMDTGKPKVFPSGDAVLQIPVDLQTELRDPANPTDTGARTLYLEKGSEKFKVVMKAVRKVQSTGGPQIGAWLKIAWTDNVPNKRGSGLDKKLYSCEYSPASENFFAGESAPASNGGNAFVGQVHDTAPTTTAAPAVSAEASVIAELQKQLAALTAGQSVGAGSGPFG